MDEQSGIWKIKIFEKAIRSRKNQAIKAWKAKIARKKTKRRGGKSTACLRKKIRARKIKVERRGICCWTSE